MPNRRSFAGMARARAVAVAGVQALRAGDGGEPPLNYHIMIIALLYHNNSSYLSERDAWWRGRG